MYKLFINAHIILSTLFFAVAFICIMLSIYKLNKKKKFNIRDKRLAVFFLIFLYLQFITGVALYFFFKPELSQATMTLQEAVENSRFRFWITEHLATMIFALVLSQIGWILIRNSSVSKNKFRTIIFYYGISLIIIVVSTSIALIKEGIF